VDVAGSANTAVLEDLHELLQPWAVRAFEHAYREQSRRTRCSRQDFWAGYRAALIELRAASQFREWPDV
jgi:hypothetical protein